MQSLNKVIIFVKFLWILLLSDGMVQMKEQDGEQQTSDFCLQYLMTNLNREMQGKQLFKAKVGVLMQQYERNQQESLLQKQQLKQQIMQQIINKRQHQLENASQPEDKTLTHTQSEHSSEPFPRIPAPPPSDSYLAKVEPRTNNRVFTHPHVSSEVNSVPRFEDPHEEGAGFQEMTFNLQRKKKSLEEGFSFKSSIAPQQVVKKTAETIQKQEDDEEMTKSVNRIAKMANKYPALYQESPQEEQQDQEEVVEAVPYVYPTLNNPTFLKEDMSDNPSASYLKKAELSSHYQPRKHSENSEDQEDQVVEEKIEEDENRGVFLTMEESESMDASEIPKNCAFEVKMEESVDPDHLEELRKQKFKELEAKRLERIQEFRKKEAQKKPMMPKGRASQVSKKSKEDEEPFKEEFLKEDLPKQVPKSSTIERKSAQISRPPKLENRSQREMIPKQKSSYTAIHDPDVKHLKEPVSEFKAVSPQRTPKTSQHRGKSTQNRNSNIFTSQSQYSRDRSARRVAEPKIEPKDRKNSFSRHNNKNVMMNAITNVFFPGEVNKKEREKHLEVIENSEYEFFVFLFKEYSSRKIIKGIYILDNDQKRLRRIYGEKAPAQITDEQVHEFYGFNTGSKKFYKTEGCKGFSLQTYAIELR